MMVMKAMMRMGNNVGIRYGQNCENKITINNDNSIYIQLDDNGDDGDDSILLVLLMMTILS